MGVRRAKVAIFAVSGFIAGCAGALFGGISGAVGGTSFEPVSSLVIVLFAFVGGITTVTGALFAGTLFALLAYVEQTFPDLAGLAFSSAERRVGTECVGTCCSWVSPDY